jgi:eukaryotic-like serine/threonine-protein kinase
VPQGESGDDETPTFDPDREPTALSSPQGQRKHAGASPTHATCQASDGAEQGAVVGRPTPLSLPPAPEEAAPVSAQKSRVRDERSFPRAVTATGLGTTRASVDALSRERAVQAGTALGLVAALSAIGAGVLQFALRKPSTHYVVTAALVLLTVVAVAQAHRLRSGRAAADAWSMSAVGIAASVVALAMVAHVGVLSAITMVLPVLVYYFGMSDLHARAVIVYGVCAGGYLLLAALASLGVLPLTGGLLPLAENNVRGLGFMTVFAEVMLAGTFALGRRSRHGTLQAMQALEKAQRELHRQGALLVEARADLDLALDAGRVGRFSGNVVGDYHLDEVLGRGGMGEVYRAVHVETGEPAAVKVLHSSLQGEPEHVARFFREAEIASALRSPHIVEVLSTGRASDGAPFIAMEFLSGYDLAHALRKHKRLAEPDIIVLVTQVALALAAAQDAGIVHRDIKPQNLFWSRAGEAARWKVLDFGISKMAGSAATLTQGAIVGTPGYMSPEQARGLAVDPRSDVFSFGAIIYRVLTGRPAFSSPDPLVTLDRVARSMPVRPTELVDAHPYVDLALALALAKDPERRFRSATELAKAFEAALRGELDPAVQAAAEGVLATHPWHRG